MDKTFTQKKIFNIEKLLEMGAPDGASSRYSWANADWASKWPTEEVWFVRLSK
ncbi:MAG: hypothetical protein Ct9H90mP4_10180 [Gammaproteobacteria bacterium]|nr:MAG: hypothetical protein Ct9H90mP4_10180 [Gammaproteobacteria bacterium]